MARNALALLRKDLLIGRSGRQQTVNSPAALSPQDKGRYLSFWSDYMGERDLSAQQFMQLNKMLSSIEAAGGRALILDLPIPVWHAQGAVHHQIYKKNVCRT